MLISVAGSTAHAAPLVSVGDVVVAPWIQIGDVDVLEDVLEHITVE
ncbi:hypothetical protein [Crossiella sp. NPDC003009]